jgi:Platelet-activating factor acetylhydrolase, isoform II
MALPLPTGSFAVGTVVHRLTDFTRPKHLMSSAQGREIFLKLWYPAQGQLGASAEVLWDELQDPHRTPLLARWTLRLVQRRSASYPKAPLAANLPAIAMVFYNHGLVSFASENTSLMQELASRGHIVIAVEHAEQLPEFRALNAAQGQKDKERARVLSAKLRRADPPERARLAG